MKRKTKINEAKESNKVDANTDSNVEFTGFKSGQAKKGLLATILWVGYFSIGIILSVTFNIVPMHIVIDFSKGVALKMILVLVCTSILKYIGLFSAICLFFVIKRKENPKYFAFIFGFYTILLILCCLGVVFSG